MAKKIAIVLYAQDLQDKRSQQKCVNCLDLNFLNYNKYADVLFFFFPVGQKYSCMCKDFMSRPRVSVTKLGPAYI